MVASYDSHGIQFNYPENWRLSESSSERLPHEISLESPDGCLWTLHVFPSASGGRQLADDALRTLAEQYDSLESSFVRETIGGAEIDGYEVHFFCLDLLVQAQIRWLQTTDHTLLWLYQAEDRVFDGQQLVFSAIATSLVQNLPANAV